MAIVRRERAVLPDTSRRFLTSEWDKPWLCVEELVEDENPGRSELRNGPSSRSVPFTVAAIETDVSATYREGVLETRVPAGEEPTTPVATIPLARS